MPVSIPFAWGWILCGLISGAGIGLAFHQQDWLGGYSSWRRRMVRLGHISFLGTGLLNLGYGLCLVVLKLPQTPRLATAAFILGAVTMPMVCFLSAWREPLRHLFVVPVASLLLAVGEFLWVSLVS